MLMFNIHKNIGFIASLEISFRKEITQDIKNKLITAYLQ